MAAAKKTKPNTAYLEQQAEAVRAALASSGRQSEVFRAAGKEDADERAAIESAIEALSKGFVIEWETESFLDEAAAKVGEEGAEARCVAVGKRLAELGHAEAG